MNKKTKKVNPYEKKQKWHLNITRKQWMALISVASVIALIAGIVVAMNLAGNSSDPHAGHNHGDLPEGHYEGDGHDHGTPATNGHSPNDGHNHSTENAADKVKYQIYTNEDKTYRLVFRDNAGKTMAEFDHITQKPTQQTVNADKGVYELGWATDKGANDYECVYYNAKTGQVSQSFRAPRGTDGVRVAYGSADQTKVIVQDLYNKDTYYKEYELKNGVEKNGNIITGGKLQADKKTVVISYFSSETESGTAHATIHLYE